MTHKSTRKGARIGAMLGAAKETKRVSFLGYGVYEGDETPPPEINPTLNNGRPNPKLVLDNGKVVWGMECWWGDAAKFEELLEDYLAKGWTIVDADIDEARAEAAAARRGIKPGPTEKSRVPPGSTLH